MIAIVGAYSPLLLLKLNIPAENELVAPPQLASVGALHNAITLVLYDES